MRPQTERLIRLTLLAFALATLGAGWQAVADAPLTLLTLIARGVIALVALTSIVVMVDC